ncbi:hypothetical protein SAMN05421594_3371 [Chryseobacterium oleae]|uniref:Uncharacterized protein n=1 Tax=Chryseobacterium oleae TaxID=491207 RepID=A0A1I5A6B0_CHROL|nr:hypothetical protein SAMN05421594_3371 [Chryseobacterium oleae]
MGNTILYTVQLWELFKSLPTIVFPFVLSFTLFSLLFYSLNKPNASVITFNNTPQNRLDPKNHFNYTYTIRCLKAVFPKSGLQTTLKKSIVTDFSKSVILLCCFAKKIEVLSIQKKLSDTILSISYFSRPPPGI